MLGLTILKYGSELVCDDYASNQPTSAFSQRQGVYNLITGTDGCPAIAAWTEQCEGFVVRLSSPGKAYGPIPFCRINNGSRIFVTDTGKFLERTRFKNQYVHRSEKLLMPTASALIAEDTVILDVKKEQFQLEHSRYGRGYSCLYGK
ncbi:MAG: hypothetical protein J7501_10565 [Bdellovibrio sp.]|nr:hypothetical protein [Bdellovibrio sp.]